MATHTENVTTYDAQGKVVETRTITWETTPEQDNEETLRSQAAADLDVLRAAIDACNVVIAKTNAQITAADTKELARRMKDVARASVRIARLTVGALDSTDSGAA